MLSKKYDIHEIKAENKRRLQRINAEFNPITGEGSHVRRVKVVISPGNVVYVPYPMKNDPLVAGCIKHGSMLQYVRNVCRRNLVEYTQEHFDQAYLHFTDLRLDEDFEYWAFVTTVITDKKSGIDIPFRLNLPQRMLVARFEKLRLKGRPIRVIVTKARQWGGSTVTQIYMAWIQIRRRIGWNSVIVAEIENQARNIRGMFTKMAKEYPSFTALDRNGDPMEHLRLVPFEQSSKTRQIQGRGNLIDISSTEKPENTRGFDYAMCHMSEVGSWRGTANKTPEDLVQSIRGGVKKGADSMIVMESTAKGVGNFFHREWLAAKENPNGYYPFFMPWHIFNDYLSPIADKDILDFIKTMDESDWHRWEQGATLQGIKWYREYMHNENFDRWRMESEFPGDDIEAFQSTGSPVFHIQYVNELRKGCTTPIAKGTLIANSMMGSKDVLRNIRFEPTPEGRLWIWEYPDKSITVKNRYVVTVDIGGTTDEADWSVVRVIDRYWMMEGGNPRAVATWRGHIDQDLLAWMACQIAEWYNRALLVIESNSLRKNEKDPGGDHFLTVLDKIADVYDNIYTRTDPEKVREGAPVLYGWHTNRSTKPLAINTLKAAVRDSLYDESDMRVCDEMQSFMLMDDGSMGAVDGMHDDMVMSTAIGLRVSDEMPLPVEIKPANPMDKIMKRSKSVNESTF